MFGMVSPLRSGLLFHGRKELDVDFALCLGLQLLRQYEFLGGRFAELICL